MTIELSQEEINTLTFALGIAIGASLRDGEEHLAKQILDLANAVHKDNPRWKPYIATAPPSQPTAPIVPKQGGL